MFDKTDPRSKSRPTLADRRAQATRDAIVEAAWALSRREGLMGWSLRQLATEVGLAAPTLYAYVDGKHAIFDAMFKQGFDQLVEIATGWKVQPGETYRAAFKRVNHAFFEFCTADPTRHQLMFQRVIPDFVPSDQAYGASLALYEQFRETSAAMGVTADSDLDLWTAMSTGLIDQQISNDPGGDRWERLLDTAVDLYCDHVGVEPDASPSPEEPPS